MQLRVYVDRAHRELLVSLAGELDLATAQRLTEALDAFEAHEFDQCFVDISEVTFCDCAGLNALISAYQAITEAGGHPTISGARRPVKRIAAIAGCDWLFDPAAIGMQPAAAPADPALGPKPVAPKLMGPKPPGPKPPGPEAPQTAAVLAQERIAPAISRPA